RLPKHVAAVEMPHRLLALIHSLGTPRRARLRSLSRALSTLLHPPKRREEAGYLEGLVSWADNSFARCPRVGSGLLGLSPQYPSSLSPPPFTAAIFGASSTDFMAARVSMATQRPMRLLSFRRSRSSARTCSRGC